MQATGVEFPEVVSLWGSSERFRSMGAGVRAKKFAFLPVKARSPLLYGVQDELTDHTSWSIMHMRVAGRQRPVHQHVPELCAARIRCVCTSAKMRATGSRSFLK